MAFKSFNVAFLAISSTSTVTPPKRKEIIELSPYIVLIWLNFLINFRIKDGDFRIKDNGFH
jgi:hypothetical protein